MAAFRSLAPSARQGESSASPSARPGIQDESSSTGATSGGIGGSAGGRTGAGTSGGSGGGYGGTGDGSLRKRRAAGSVSAMACRECRQARQRCDGQKPHPCGRCLQRKLNCVYEPHTKTHKDDLIREMEDLRGENAELQSRNRDVEQTATDLEAQNKGLQQTSDWQKLILDTIASNGHERDVISKLRAGDSHQDIAEWLMIVNPSFGSLGSGPATSRSLVDVVKIFEKQYRDSDGLQRMGESNVLGTPWTEVSTDHKLIGHLFDLYFTWVHPVHMIFSEPDFKRDFRNHHDIFCSSPLVNAICAMACHLLENEEGEEKHFFNTRTGLDAATLTKGFMDEARRTLSPDSYANMTSIQTLAVMYLTDLSSGKARSATGYLRAAVEGLNTLEKGLQSDEAKELTFWGIQTLNTSCIATTFQKLYAPPTPRIATFQHVQMDKDAEIWRFYRQPGDKDEMPTRPSFAIMTACYQAGLFCLINDSIKLYCGTKGSITAKAVCELYQRYLDWRENLPAMLKNVGEHDNPLPHVLYLNIQYQTALTQLLEPIVRCGFFTGSTLDELRRMLVHHARKGLEHLHHCRRLYTSRFSVALLSFCCVLLGDAHISHSRQDPTYPGPEIVKFCLTLLQQTRAGFALCGPLQETFRRRANECGVELPMGVEEMLYSFSHYGMDEIMDACTRLSYTQPTEQIFRHIDSTIAQEWQAEWAKAEIGRIRRQSSTSGRVMQIDTLLND